MFGGRGGGARTQGIPADADRRPGGFGVRVVHSGVWGFASSPIVTEDELRRISAVAVEVAKASAIAKRASVDLPQPDSPTMPTLRPLYTVTSTPCRACTRGAGCHSWRRGRR
jgi:hypothetical protein